MFHNFFSSSNHSIFQAFSWHVLLNFSHVHKPWAEAFSMFEVKCCFGMLRCFLNELKLFIHEIPEPMFFVIRRFEAEVKQEIYGDLQNSTERD